MWLYSNGWKNARLGRAEGRRVGPRPLDCARGLRSVRQDHVGHDVILSPCESKCVEGKIPMCFCLWALPPRAVYNRKNL